MPITPTLVQDFETRVHTIVQDEYLRLTQNLWWQQVATVKPSLGETEYFNWLLNTVQIQDQGLGGNLAYSDLVTEATSIANRDSGVALRIRKNQLDDVYNGIKGGLGYQLGADWAKQVGAYMAYWPQKKVVDVLKNGHTVGLYPAYTTKALFATDHPLNPYNLAAGTYKNLFTGGDAADISVAVTPDVALANMSKVFSLIATIKQANGEDPRYLRPKAILCAPKLYPRAVQLTDAKFLAMAAASGGGGADVTGLIKALGFGTPIMVDELAGFESDTSWFVVAEQLAASDLGGIVYLEREPYSITSYGLMTDADLGRAQQLEWQCHGRNGIAPGHPFLIFKVKAA